MMDSLMNALGFKRVPISPEANALLLEIAVLEQKLDGLMFDHTRQSLELQLQERKERLNQILNQESFTDETSPA